MRGLLLAISALDFTGLRVGEAVARPLSTKAKTSTKTTAKTV